MTKQEKLIKNINHDIDLFNTEITNILNDSYSDFKTISSINYQRLKQFEKIDNEKTSIDAEKDQLISKINLLKDEIILNLDLKKQQEKYNFYKKKLTTIISSYSSLHKKIHSLLLSNKETLLVYNLAKSLSFLEEKIDSNLLCIDNRFRSTFAYEKANIELGITKLNTSFDDTTFTITTSILQSCLSKVDLISEKVTLISPYANNDNPTISSLYGNALLYLTKNDLTIALEYINELLKYPI